jgi:hypothetical protein
MDNQMPIRMSFPHAFGTPIEKALLMLIFLTKAQWYKGLLEGTPYSIK